MTSLIVSTVRLSFMMILIVALPVPLVALSFARLGLVPILHGIVEMICKEAVAFFTGNVIEAGVAVIPVTVIVALSEIRDPVLSVAVYQYKNLPGPFFAPSIVIVCVLSPELHR